MKTADDPIILSDPFPAAPPAPRTPATCPICVSVSAHDCARLRDPNKKITSDCLCECHGPPIGLEAIGAAPPKKKRGRPRKPAPAPSPRHGPASDQDCCDVCAAPGARACAVARYGPKAADCLCECHDKIKCPACGEPAGYHAENCATRAPDHPTALLDQAGQPIDFTARDDDPQEAIDAAPPKKKRGRPPKPAPALDPPAPPTIGRTVADLEKHVAALPLAPDPTLAPRPPDPERREVMFILSRAEIAERQNRVLVRTAELHKVERERRDFLRLYRDRRAQLRREILEAADAAAAGQETRAVMLTPQAGPDGSDVLWIDAEGQIVAVEQAPRQLLIPGCRPRGRPKKPAPLVSLGGAAPPQIAARAPVDLAPPPAAEVKRHSRVRKSHKGAAP